MLCTAEERQASCGNHRPFSCDPWSQSSFGVSKVFKSVNVRQVIDQERLGSVSGCFLLAYPGVLDIAGSSAVASHIHFTPSSGNYSPSERVEGALFRRLANSTAYVSKSFPQRQKEDRIGEYRST